MKRVLLVEDDFILAMVHRKYLELSGFQVIDSVTNGPDAIRVALEQKPDLVIMDIRLEGSMDGIEAVSEIQKVEKIPAVFVTGNSEPAAMERAEKLYTIGFLVKPLHLEDLTRLAKQL